MFEYKVCFTVLLLVALSSNSFSQIIPSPSRPPRTADPNRPDPSTQRWYDELRRRENTPTGIGAINDRNVIEAAVAENAAKARKEMAPSREEKKLYSEFLRHPNTGLVRIASTFNCKHIVDVTRPNQECHKRFIPGGALAFSFRRNDYTHDAYADIKRVNDDFVLPGTFILGLITSLGDAPIETIGADNVLVSDLAAFVPAKTLADAAGQNFEVARGLKIGDLRYSKIVPIREHTTYLLRSVAFRAKFRNLPKSTQNRGSLDDDERRDVLVVFRVVSKGADGSYLLLWKELLRKESPILMVDAASQ